jgi:hypothetical protein
MALPLGAASAEPLKTLDEAASYLAKQASKPLRPFSTRDFGRENYAEARSVIVPPNKAQSLLATVRKQLAPGLIAFVGTENSLATPRPDGVEVVVAHGKTQFDILRVAASNAVNYDLLTEDLIKQLETWDAAYGIDIFQASTDTVQFRLKSQPKDLKQFAAEIYRFCPDIVDQGTGTVEKLEQEIRSSKSVFLWWD